MTPVLTHADINAMHREVIESAGWAITHVSQTALGPHLTTRRDDKHAHGDYRYGLAGGAGPENP